MVVVLRWILSLEDPTGTYRIATCSTSGVAYVLKTETKSDHRSVDVPNSGTSVINSLYADDHYSGHLLKMIF